VTDGEWPEEIVKLLGSLTDLERRVFLLRSGLDRGEPRTLEEVSEAVGVSRQEVRAIEVAALQRLKVDLDLD
jgi:DNA-directed RNA polymerase sigma subunit (sigma70/sigma32)